MVGRSSPVVVCDYTNRAGAQAPALCFFQFKLAPSGGDAQARVSAEFAADSNALGRSRAGSAKKTASAKHGRHISRAPEASACAPCLLHNL